MKAAHGSVILTQAGEYFWLGKIKNGSSLAVNEKGTLTHISASTIKESAVFNGNDAMPILKERFYGKKEKKEGQEEKEGCEEKTDGEASE